MTGAELARTVKETYPHIAIIVATGYAELPEGEDDTSLIPRLSKPFRQEELAAAIMGIVGVPPISDPFVSRRAS
jgi:two-component SAPR family response regulator